MVRISVLQNYDFNKMEFSDTQVNALADNWSVTAHQKDTASGFSSTLLQNVPLANDGFDHFLEAVLSARWPKKRRTEKRKSWKS